MGQLTGTIAVTSPGAVCSDMGRPWEKAMHVVLLLCMDSKKKYAWTVEKMLKVEVNRT